MKNIFLIVCACFMVCTIQAQEEYIFKQYYLNPATVNPGAVGFNQHHTILLNYRNTWTTFPNGPKTFSGHYNGEVADNVGLGAYILSDQYANLGTIRGGVSFAYMIKGESYKIGAGFSTQYHQYRVAGLDLSSDLIDATDARLLERLKDGQFFEATMGVHGLLDNGLFFDLAFPGVVRAQLSNASSEKISPATFNYFFGAGYPFKLRDYDMEIVPSVYFKKFRNIPLHVDINALMKFMDGKFQSGVTYTAGLDNSLGFLIGTKINNLFFNYSYNFSFHESQQFNNGGHEIGLGFNLNGKSKEKLTK